MIQQVSNPRRAAQAVSQARMAAVREQVGKFVAESLQAVFERLREHFFVAARDATDAEQEARFIEMMEEADRIEASVSKRYQQLLASHLESLGEREVLLMVPEDDTRSRKPSHMLSLVDSVKLDDWVKLGNILKRHQPRLEDTQLAVRQRLESLTGVALCERTDPLTVEALCSQFHDAVQTAKVSRGVRSALLDGFERGLIRRLDILYIGLLGTLSAPLGRLDVSLNDEDTGALLDGPEEAPAAAPPGRDPDAAATAIETDEAAIEPDAALIEPGPELIEPDAALSEPDAALIEPDAAMIEPDSTLIEPDSALIEADSALIEADSALIEPDSALIEPDRALIEPETGPIELDDEAPDEPMSDTGPLALEPAAEPITAASVAEAPVLQPAAPAPAVVAPHAPALEPSPDAARLNGVINTILRSARHRGLADPDDVETLERWLLDYSAEAASGVNHESVRALALLTTSVLSAATHSQRSRTRLWRMLPALLHLMVCDDAYLDRELGAARHDPVTGLLDRAAFHARLDRALTLAESRGGRVVVARVRVNELSRVELDLGGVVAGRLLRLLGTLLMRQLTGRALAARYSSDEFAVLLERASSSQGEDFAQALQRAVSQTSWRHDGRRVDLTLDIGLADSKRVGTDPEALLAAARPGSG